MGTPATSTLLNPVKRKGLPSRAALESLGRLGLRDMVQSDTPERDEEAVDLSRVESFSPQGFTLKRLPPVKPGLRYGQSGRRLFDTDRII